MPLAGDQQQIARTQQPGGREYRLAAVADFLRLGGGGQDGAADGARILAARIVVGDENQIGQALGDGAHQGPLALVAVAAAAEHQHQPARAMRAQRLERGFERVGGMGVIDDQLRARRMDRGQLHASRRALETGKRAERRLGFDPRGERQAQRAQRVHRLESAQQGQIESVALARQLDFDAETGILGFGLDEPQLGPLGPAIADGLDSAPAAERGERAAFRLIDIDHGGAVFGQQFGKEPRLGGEIGRHVRVIVKMVAGQVGEAGGSQLDAVEAELVEAVARGFERQMVDAHPRQFLQFLVQLDRVGGGEAAGSVDPRRDHADGAEARRLQPGALPDLAQEHRDRGLAVGAGDGGGCRGLRRVIERRHQRERPARIGIHHHRHRQIDRPVGEHGAGAALQRIVEKTPPVGAPAGEGGEQITGLHHARIRRQTKNIGVPRRRDVTLAQGAAHELS